MTRRKHITDELIALGSQLATVDPVNPYTAPPGYFETLPAMIMMRIKTASVSSAKEELEMISPLLAGLKKSNPFTVPEGYFENLQPARQPAKVVSMPVRKVFRYAAAAVMIGLITVLAWFFINRDTTGTGQLASNSDSATRQQVLTNMDSISDNEISDFLAGTLSADEQAAAGADIADDDVSLMLADISDQELEKYIELQTPVKQKFN